MLVRGHWSVDAEGVVGGVDVWRAAETEERWRDYVTPMGPGGYW